MGNINGVRKRIVSAAVLMTEDIRKRRTIHTETPLMTEIPKSSPCHPYSTRMEPLLPGRDSLLPAPSNDMRCYRITSGFWPRPFLAGTRTKTKTISSLNCPFETDSSDFSDHVCLVEPSENYWWKMSSPFLHSNVLVRAYTYAPRRHFESEFACCCRELTPYHQSHLLTNRLFRIQTRSS